MIGRLKGAVAEVGAEEAIVEAGGVGWLVRCSSRTLARLAPGEEALVHVETQWSEATGPRLYGFLAREERAAFVALQEVQGVGPKAALAVLDVLAPSELAAAVARGDRQALGRAQGVGPKLAARIVAELKDKPLAAGLAATAAGAPPPAPNTFDSAWSEALAALTGLGWADLAARRALEDAAARLGAEADVAALLKQALRGLDR